MGIMQTLEVLNGMVADGVIDTYAIGGAVAAYNYVEATMTEDLDILVSLDAEVFQNRSGILSYLANKGYTEFHQEGVLIEGWPVQFLPVADDLDHEALYTAHSVSISLAAGTEAIETRILRPEHVIAAALKTGRPKDMMRIAQFIEERAFDRDMLEKTLERHRLTALWNEACDRLNQAGHKYEHSDSPGPGD